MRSQHLDFSFLNKENKWSNVFRNFYIKIKIKFLPSAHLFCIDLFFYWNNHVVSATKHLRSPVFHMYVCWGKPIQKQNNPSPLQCTCFFFLEKTNNWWAYNKLSANNKTTPNGFKFKKMQPCAERYRFKFLEGDWPVLKGSYVQGSSHLHPNGGIDSRAACVSVIFLPGLSLTLLKNGYHIFQIYYLQFPFILVHSFFPNVNMWKLVWSCDINLTCFDLFMLCMLFEWLTYPSRVLSGAVISV